MRLLYIEDDEIDVLALKRLLRSFKSVQMDVCTLLRDLIKIDLSNYDIIISDANLPDGSYKELSKLLPPKKTHFISGSEIENFEVWIKPISLDQLEEILTRDSLLDLTYIRDLADGDAEYEQEMIGIALRVLPERLEELNRAKHDEQALRKAAHKTKSSFRVCGVNNSLLTELELLKGSAFSNENNKNKILNGVKDQIEKVIEELKELKT
jgi:hypothetical protein